MKSKKIKSRKEVFVKRFGFLLIFGALLATAWMTVRSSVQPGRSKYLIVLQASKETHEGMARAVHALLYARELAQHGHEVRLMFDGAGTEWIEELTDPESTSKLKPAYQKFQQAGIVEIVCDYCAGAFGVKAQLGQRNISLTDGFEGHPSLAKWADQGYRILIL